MSTLKARKTDTDGRTHHSESDMITIGDLVVWHQMPFLSVRMLTQLNCPRWSMWDSYNVTRISKARTLDNTRDWYFPIIVRKEGVLTEASFPWVLRDLLEEYDGDFYPLNLPEKDVWASWSGIWHSSPEHASAEAHPLPPMTYLPHEWLHFSNPRDDILASAGGLLLIKGMSGVVPVRRSKRLNPLLADSIPSSISGTTKSAAGASNNGRKHNRKPQWWQRLLVCNPLTRECRELPAADCRLLGLNSWHAAYQNGVQVRLVVDEEASRYQVILTLSELVAVYTSTTNSWNCLRFPQERGWGRRLPVPNYGLVVTWEYICASAHVGGRLYFANVKPISASDISSKPTERATDAAILRLFEVNAEEGTWELVHPFTLRKFHIPTLKSSEENSLYDMEIIPYLEIMECMGSLYAVLPAKVHDAWLVGESELHHDWMSDTLHSVNESGNKLASMPICFYIMQLQEHRGVDCGVLRIQIPLKRSDFQRRRQNMQANANHVRWFFRNWFSCEARGSVIWVACEDYVLSFDVVSRKSTTQIIALDTGAVHPFGEDTLRLAYRPSLHMKP